MDTVIYEKMATPAWPPEHRHGQRRADLVFVAQAIAAAAIAVDVKIAAWDAGHADDLDLAAIHRRLGALQWHLANLAALTGASLTEIMIDGVADLEARHGTKDPTAWYEAEKAADAAHAGPSAAETQTSTLAAPDTQTIILAAPDTLINLPWVSPMSFTPHDISAPARGRIRRASDGDYTQ